MSEDLSLQLVAKVLYGVNSRSCYRRHIGMGRRPWLWVVMLRKELAMVAARCAL
jgi:hypothetical protein